MAKKRIPIPTDGPDVLEYVVRDKAKNVCVFENGKPWWILTTEDFKKEFGIDIKETL